MNEDLIRSTDRAVVLVCAAAIAGFVVLLFLL